MCHFSGFLCIHWHVLGLFIFGDLTYFQCFGHSSLEFENKAHFLFSLYKIDKYLWGFIYSLGYSDFLLPCLSTINSIQDFKKVSKSYMAILFQFLFYIQTVLFLYYSVQFSYSVMSKSLQSHVLQHARLPCPSPTLGACSNSCPLGWWCHPTISCFCIMKWYYLACEDLRKFTTLIKSTE